MHYQSYAGYVALEGTLKTALVAADNNGTPTNAAALPTYRVYGPNGYLGVSGTVSFLNSGSITNVSAANPAVITSASHGLTTGARVTITGVTGTGAITNANTTAVATRIDDNTFSIPVDTSGGTYTSGGTWNTTGAYRVSIDATAASGFAAGENYTVVFNFTVSSTAKGPALSFSVV